MNGVACPHCPARMPDTHILALHVGQEHAGDASVEERQAFHRAIEDEDRAMAHLRRHVRGALYAFPLVLFYLFFVLMAAVNDVAYWAVLPAPGVVIFGMLVYHLGYTRDEAPDRAAPPA